MRFVQISQHDIHGASQVFNNDTRMWVNSVGLVYGFHTLGDLNRMNIRYQVFEEIPASGAAHGCIICPISGGTIGSPVSINYDTSG